VAVSKGKDTQDGRQASLIPVIERHEQQLRTELEQVRREAEEQIRQAGKRAEQYIRESHLSAAELVEQRQKEGLAERQRQAELLSRSSEQRIAHLQQQAKRNMARAVHRVVAAVIGTPYGVTAVGDET